MTSDTQKQQHTPAAAEPQHAPATSHDRPPGDLSASPGNAPPPKPLPKQWGQPAQPSAEPKRSSWNLATTPSTTPNSDLPPTSPSPPHGGQPQPAMQTPWLPPWVATQATQGGPPGVHIPLAATQFQWQATHPSTTGGYVTSWGGYSLAPNTALQTNQFGVPMVQPPPQQYSLQLQPGNPQQAVTEQPPPATHTPLLPQAQVHQQPPPQQHQQWPQHVPHDPQRNHTSSKGECFPQHKHVLPPHEHTTAYTTFGTLVHMTPIQTHGTRTNPLVKPQLHKQQARGGLMATLQQLLPGP